MQIVNGVIYAEVSVPVRWFETLENKLGIKMDELPKEVIEEFFSHCVGFGAEATTELKEILDKHNNENKV